MLLVKQFPIYYNLRLLYSLQAEPTSQLLKNCFFVSFEGFYLSFKYSSLFFQYQFVTNKQLLVTITFETSPKLGGNQIPGGGLGIYAIKIESTAVEMF